MSETWLTASAIDAVLFRNLNCPKDCDHDADLEIVHRHDARPPPAPIALETQ